MERVDRRALLAAAGGLLLPGTATGQVTQQIGREEVDGKRWCSFPGFERVLDNPAYEPNLVCGWRPERQVNGVSTVRLESIQVPGGPLIVHNYGHGGAGVTLGLGCAALTERWLSEVARRPRNSVIVIVGAGVVGLSMAYVLKARGYTNVVVRARAVSSGSFDNPATVSDIAGGQFDSAGVAAISGDVISQVQPRSNALDAAMRETLAVLTARRGIDNDPFTVRGRRDLYIYTVVRNYTTDPTAVPGALNAASNLVIANPVLNASIIRRYGSVPPHGGESGVIAPFFELQSTRLTNEPIRFGVRDTVLINTANLLSNIRRYLETTLDGPIVRVDSGAAASVESAAALQAIAADIVINCSGLAGAVLGGEGSNVSMVGRYGLLARLNRLESGYGPNAPRYLYSGLGYMFPRSDGTIIGGAWDGESALAMRERTIPQIAALPAVQQAEYFNSLRPVGDADRIRGRNMVRTVGSFFLGRRRQLARLRPDVESWLSGARHFDCAVNPLTCLPPQSA